MHFKHDNTLLLAHYYTSPEVQDMADVVGDSMDLALAVTKYQPKRVVQASVQFMAETTKILNPEAEVILPDSGSTCSLVKQTDIEKLKLWRKAHSNYVHVAYINSSAEHKTTADIIVTSRIVDDVFKTLFEQGQSVIFSPDKNMGRYLNLRHDTHIPLWDAVCEVHDQFDHVQLDHEYQKWTDGGKYLIAHIESPLAVLDKADYVGSTYGMLQWAKNLPYKVGTVYVATESGLLYNLRQLRSDLVFKQAPTLKSCACAECPYMKLNTKQQVLNAVVNGKGLKIDYLSNAVVEKARVPINRMIDFQHTGKIHL